MLVTTGSLTMAVRNHFESGDSRLGEVIRRVFVSEGSTCQQKRFIEIGLKLNLTRVRFLYDVLSNVNFILQK